MTLRLAAALASMAVAVVASDVKLTMTTSSTEVPAGAPIVLRITMEAVMAMKAVPEVSAAGGNFELWITNLNNGAVTRYMGPRWAQSGTLGAARDLSAGQSITQELSLLYQPAMEDRPDVGEKRLPFTPARYRISLEYKGLGKERHAFANTVVTVREPSAPAEAAWWKALGQEPSLAEAMQTGDFEGRPDLLKRLESLVQTHANVAHADAAAVAVGRYYVRVEKDPGKALPYLRLAGRNEADPGIRRRAMLESADALELAGATGEAASVRKQAEDATGQNK